MRRVDKLRQYCFIQQFKKKLIWMRGQIVANNNFLFTSSLHEKQNHSFKPFLESSNVKPFKRGFIISGWLHWALLSVHIDHLCLAL